MYATTEQQKARFLDLVTGMLEMVRDGNRDIESVSQVIQIIKDSKDFAAKLLVKTMVVWKTLMVGGLNKSELLSRLAQAGRDVGGWAKDVMSKPTFKTSAKSHEVSFIRVKVKDLGFTKAPTTTELFTRIKELGELCEPEDALRLALEDQPCGDWFWVAMEPIAVSGGGPEVFGVARYVGGARWLCTDYAGPDGQWGLGDELVFRSRK